jgi:hypothetical protein
MNAVIPSLSVRAYAELLNLPAVEQLRVLNDQKYPKSEPQTFRIPFYQTALQGIRSYYRSGNQRAALAAARARAQALSPEAKRNHNVRVLAQFEKGPQAKRKLLLKASPRYSTTIAGVELRLQFDLVVEEEKTMRFILYNLRAVPIEIDTARATLEIAHWVLEQAGRVVPIQTLEYIDIPSGASRTIKKRRIQTINRVKQNARVIQTLWPTI